MADNSLPEGFQVDAPAPTPKDDDYAIDQQSNNLASAQNTSGLPSGFSLDEDKKSKDGGLPVEYDPAAQDKLAANQAKYGSTGQQIAAGVEGLASGVLGKTITSGVETALGVPTEDQVGRAEANPWTHGISEATGLGGSLLMAAPVKALQGLTFAAKVAQGAEAMSLGSTALKLGLEGAMFGLDNEASKYILGTTDPEDGVAAKIAHSASNIVLSGLGSAAFGKLLGTVTTSPSSTLKDVADAKVSSKMAQFLADLGRKVYILKENPDVHAAAADEATSLFSALGDSYDEIWGSGKLKDQAIKKLAPEINDKVMGQFSNITNRVQEAINTMVKNPEDYDAHNINTLKRILKEATSGEGMNSADIFEKINDLKSRMQALAKDGRKYTETDKGYKFVEDLSNMAPDFKRALEDENVWGKLGGLQKDVNSAFSDVLPYQKEFQKTFTVPKVVNIDGRNVDTRVVDPGRIQTLLNNVGKAKGQIKVDKALDFIPRAKKMIQQVESIHNSLGTTSNLPVVSTEVLDTMLGDHASAGGKLGQWLVNAGPKMAGSLAAKAGAATAGAAIGGPLGALAAYKVEEHLGPIIEQGIGKKLTTGSIAALLKMLSKGSYEGVPDAIQYGNDIQKGINKIGSITEGIFKVGGNAVLDSNHEKNKAALKKYIENGTQNQQMMNQNLPPPLTNNEEPQNFAEGGMVLAPQPTQPVDQPVGKLLTKSDDHIATAFPEQSMLLGATKTRVNDYLNQARPQTIQNKLPFDDTFPDKQKEKSYDRALDVAVSPLSVLHHIKSGTLEPEHVQHLNGMYPELGNHLRKKLTEKIMEAQKNNEKPPYKIRQGLSLFMGAPLDSNMTPANIQAAQAVFAAQKQALQPGGGGGKKSKGATNKLEKMPGQYRTFGQAADARKQSTKP